MASDLVSCLIDPATGIATLRFERPEVLNALDLATARAFAAAVERVTRDPGVRVIVLSGAGRAFMAGGDVGSFAVAGEDVAAVVHGLLDAVHPAVLALRAAPAPVVALVRGAAAGAGFSFVLGADVVVAEETAAFLVAYDRLGATPDCGGTWFLERRVGRARAFELMLTGRRLTAIEARDIGIVTEVVPAGELEARGQALAETIARGPTQAFGRFKRLLDEAPSRRLAEQLEAERAAFVAGTGTADFREGVSAFLAKRPPSFQGR